MSVTPLFRDRHVAGLALVQALAPTHRRASHALVILGMARGGVEVAAPIARALNAPLAAFICRKLGVPGLEEVAFGAVAEGGGVPVLDDVHHFIGLPRQVVQTVIARELDEVARRVRAFRDGQPLPALKRRTVILVDDGLASGATLRAAGIAIRRLKPARIIAAVPVASVAGVRDVRAMFDDVITLATPEPFGTVSDWYQEYASVDDAAVRALLERARSETNTEGRRTAKFGDVPNFALSTRASAATITTSASREDGTTRETTVRIPINETGHTTEITGDLGHVADAKPPRGLVIFAHGGGSSRASYRNRYLAARIRLAGWATLRVDLLTPTESAADAHGGVRFDIALLARRLLAATNWCVNTRVPGADRVVLFGASTGAAAAVHVAAELPVRVAAVMSRGGRIDLAREALGRVRVPALLVVGSADHETLQQNRVNALRLDGEVTLRVVPGAGHTFEEMGALGQAGEHVVEFLGQLHRRNRLRHWWNHLRGIGTLADGSAFSRESFSGTPRAD